MVKPQKTNRASRLLGFLRKLYILVFAFSLLIVLGYAAFWLFFPAPTVDLEVTFSDINDFPTSTGDASQFDSPGKDASSQLVLTRHKDVYTCLLIGRADMGGADTIMLGVFDTGARTASLLSIPRDTVVLVNGQDLKINSTLSLGGPELVARTVSRLLGIPVDFYVETDTQAFAAIVNEIGGVWFDVPPGMDYDDPYQNLSIHIPPGYQLLNGADAVKVMRCRNAYASQDIGRVETQRKFLSAMVDQTISISNIPRVTNLINILNTYVTTDMEVSEMVYFATRAIGMDLDADLDSATLPGQWISPYYELDDEATLTLVNALGIYQGEVPEDILDIYHPSQS